MSFDVMLLVSFPCSELDAVAALARQWLPLIRPDAMRQKCPGAIAFLEDMGSRSGLSDRGPKNGLTAWTYGGNYTRPVLFAEILRPFWDNLLRLAVKGGPLRIDHVIVVYQLQDRDKADAIEIYLEPPPIETWDTDGAFEQVPLVMKLHDGLPFHW